MQEHQDVHTSIAHGIMCCHNDDADYIKWLTEDISKLDIVAQRGRINAREEAYRIWRACQHPGISFDKSTAAPCCDDCMVQWDAQGYFFPIPKEVFDRLPG